MPFRVSLGTCRAAMVHTMQIEAENTLPAVLTHLAMHTVRHLAPDVRHTRDMFQRPMLLLLLLLNEPYLLDPLQRVDPSLVVVLSRVGHQVVCHTHTTAAAARRSTSSSRHRHRCTGSSSLRSCRGDAAAAASLSITTTCTCRITHSSTTSGSATAGSWVAWGPQWGVGGCCNSFTADGTACTDDGCVCCLVAAGWRGGLR